MYQLDLGWLGNKVSWIAQKKKTKKNSGYLSLAKIGLGSDGIGLDLLKLHPYHFMNELYRHFSTNTI